MKDVKEFSLSDCAEFEAQIGYQFQNKKLLVEADVYKRQVVGWMSITQVLTMI